MKVEGTKERESGQSGKQENRMEEEEKQGQSMHEHAEVKTIIIYCICCHRTIHFK